MPAGVSAITALANITLGSAAASVTFSSIVGTYRDLLLVSQVGNVNNNDILLTFNSDSGSNYHMVRAWGDGSGFTQSDADNSYASIRVSKAYPYNDNASVYTLNIFDYAQTDKHKSGLMRIGGTRGVQMQAYRWASTSAITSLAITGSGGNLTSGSTFALYGVSA
jgi:hypothetical protein